MVLYISKEDIALPNKKVFISHLDVQGKERMQVVKPSIWDMTGLIKRTHSVPLWHMSNYNRSIISTHQNYTVIGNKQCTAHIITLRQIAVVMETEILSVENNHALIHFQLISYYLLLQ